MGHKYGCWVTAMALLLFLAGCAAPIEREGASGLSAPQQLFRVSAQVTMHTESGVKQFPIVWRRRLGADGVHDQVLIKGPLGTTYARLSASPAESVLEWEGKKMSETSATALAKRIFGFSLPIESFGYWLTGVSDPTLSTHEKILPGGEIVAIEQAGWQIDYQSRDAKGQVQQLRLQTPAGPVDIVIKEWLTQ